MDTSTFIAKKGIPGNTEPEAFVSGMYGSWMSMDEYVQFKLYQVSSNITELLYFCYSN